jgi:ABC-type phosphate transport system permease subunit
MVAGLLGLIAWNGLSVFWPRQVAQLTLAPAAVGAVPETVGGVITKYQTRRSAVDGTDHRELQVFTGNRDAHGLAFRFIDEAAVTSITYPPDIHLAERMEYGKSLFYPVRLELEQGEQIPANDSRFPAELDRLIAAGNQRRKDIRHLEKGEIGTANAGISRLELQLRRPNLAPETRAAWEQELADLRQAFDRHAAEAAKLRQRQQVEKLVYRLPDGSERSQPVADLLEVHRPNTLTWTQRLGLFWHRLWAFLSEEPREANTEGGIFPAIFGTFVMTVLMAAMVTPLGIIAAIYLHEYARPGLLLRCIRICVNNLAGVPSIVFGVFGLGFFVYGVGGFIDRGPADPLPPTWWFIAAIGAVIAMTGALILTVKKSALPPTSPARHSRLRATAEGLAWTAAAGLGVLVIAQCPYFTGFFSEKLPSPTFGTGGILWASLTLALMTLPVVIVATEEALSSVPRGVREAALACGASKWQMIQRIALPGALPGVMTGIILAMARGAGEVAPLMITGVVKLAPSLPIDTTAPFIHAERKFMHLGFHIFDLGFQSPDSEAAKPVVFATTLLLIALVVVLNLAAIQIRAHLRRKYQASAF